MALAHESFIYMKCFRECSGLHTVFIRGITINVLRGIHPVVFAVYCVDDDMHDMPSLWCVLVIKY